MPAPATIDDLIGLVRKTGVLDEKRLDTYLTKLRAASAMPSAPKELAGLMIRDGILTGFQAEQILLGKWRRFHLGKYKILERLGAGGMGSVYLCEHTLMRRRVAVKVLPASRVDDASSLERFYREARAVAALDHPNIVRAYDIDHENKIHFLVMEHVDGSSLQDIVKKAGPLDPLRAAHYISQSALGLEHAHRVAGLVHRDIKPGNILVDRTGVVKLLDMGLARFFNDEQDLITKKYDENVLGTADYLAPEQVVDSHNVDIRADIYSLGGTFYYCLTGRTPFGEGNVAQKLIWHQTRQPKPIRTFRSDVPEEITAIIEKMMAKDRSQRFQTPQEVAEALTVWIQTPIPPPPETEMPRYSPAVSRVVAAPTLLATSKAAIKTSQTPTPQKNWQVTGPSPLPLSPAAGERGRGEGASGTPKSKPPASLPRGSDLQARAGTDSAAPQTKPPQQTSAPPSSPSVVLQPGVTVSASVGVPEEPQPAPQKVTAPVTKAKSASRVIVQPRPAAATKAQASESTKTDNTALPQKPAPKTVSSAVKSNKSSRSAAKVALAPKRKRPAAPPKAQGIGRLVVGFCAGGVGVVGDTGLLNSRYRACVCSCGSQTGCDGRHAYVPS